MRRRVRRVRRSGRVRRRGVGRSASTGTGPCGSQARAIHATANPAVLGLPRIMRRVCLVTCCIPITARTGCPYSRRIRTPRRYRRQHNRPFIPSCRTRRFWISAVSMTTKDNGGRPLQIRRRHGQWAQSCREACRLRISARLCHMVAGRW